MKRRDTFIVFFLLIKFALSFHILSDLKSKISALTHNKDEDISSIVKKFEYPRSNETFRQMQKEQWSKYYECLTKKHSPISFKKIFYLNALSALEGTSIRINCDLCISPLELRFSSYVEWYFNSSNNPNITNKFIESSERLFISENNGHLMIYGVQLSDDGRYWCKLKDSVGSPHYLYIDNNFKNVKIVRPGSTVNALHPAPPIVIKDYNVKVYTEWSAWSACSKCNIVGIKTRFGYCTLSMIASLENQIKEFSLEEHKEDKSRKRNERDNQENEETDEQTNAKKKSRKASIQNLFSLFNNKFPCNSKLVPIEISNNTVVKKRKTELMIRFCKKKCRRNLIFEVRDEDGNILESVNNSAGIYSMLQKIPRLPPTVKRTIVYAVYNKKLVLQCPGNLNEDTPIIWKIGNYKFLPFNFQQQTNENIYVEFGMRIIFQKLKFQDSNIYRFLYDNDYILYIVYNTLTTLNVSSIVRSCWQNNKLVGSVRLIVTGEEELKINQHAVMIGCIAIVSVLLMAFWKAFKGQRRFTKH